MRTGQGTPSPGRERDGLRDLDLKVGYTTADRPVESFYIPVLSHSVALDRMAGYFTSGSLALAARGLAALIRNSGRMRLLVGTDLNPEDIKAIERGENQESVVTEHLLDLLRGHPNEVEKERLKALSWMVADGTLRIRVVVPRPGVGYFHSKNGIATDQRGDRIAWQGSNNETTHGWTGNYEQFSVFKSWNMGEHVEFVEKEFQQAWSGSLAGYITLPVPEAVRRKLLEYTPDDPPTHDPAEDSTQTTPSEAVLAAWLRDVPHLVGMEGRLGSTSVIEPWPHQSRVARQVVSAFPQRFLLADEVGLGKTIEVGMILRDLTLSQQVRRCLILTPASVRWQWQGELREKFGMTVPVYDGHDLVIGVGPEQTIEPLGGGHPWDRAPIMIMSSQLARRTERREALWQGPHWDLVVIDEAHHARRKDFLNRNLRRPNRLLEMLEGTKESPGGLSAKTDGLLLLTATPMQVHPVEVWDLLIQLGLPGRWGATDQNFLDYFEQLRTARSEWKEANWRLVAEMARDELRHGGRIEPQIGKSVEDTLGWAGWDRLKGLLKRPVRIASLRRPDERAAMLKILGHLTPLRRRMHRHSRQLLKSYRDQGLLPANLAGRRPEPRWVTMTPQERALYDRVEEYISDFYRKYEEKRKGLGFVMTVYRRRLTSSFHALEKSLTRRLAFLQAEVNDLSLAEEDGEDEDLASDALEELGDRSDLGSIAAQEIGYVQDFLAELGRLGTDTKYTRLEEDLLAALSTRPNVVIFTQYTDTMDHLRRKLSAIYGKRIACYSGRGGERWNPNAMDWERVGKEEIKQAFRDGKIQILLGTDAMAEGLNLQTCGVEINYDVPWNPMRLEQRIGRVDRIGQKFNTVKIWSYFLEGTIEGEVYRRLRDRIDWFEGVVGPLQPILQRVEQTIRDLALQSPGIRSVNLEKALAKINAEIEQAEREGLDLEEYQSRSTEPAESTPPATPTELEKFFTKSQTFGQRFRPHPDLPGAYRVEMQQSEQTVTFRPKLADQHPDTLRFLTFGDPVFKHLLSESDSPDLSALGLRRLEHTPQGRPRVGWYRNTPTGLSLVESLAEMQEHLAAAVFDPIPKDQAETLFRRHIERQAERANLRLQQIKDEKRSALLKRGRHLLETASYLWSARNGSLFGDNPPAVGKATLGAMIRSEGYPFAGLYKLAGGETRLHPDGPQWEKITSLSNRQQQARWRTVRTQAEELLQILASRKPSKQSSS